MLTKVELYWAMAKYTITLLTLLSLLLLVLFDTPPPVLGCGPERSFPSPQASLSLYALSTYSYYMNMAPSKYSEFVSNLLVCNVGMVTIALLHLGMASPPSLLAGAVLGCITACLLHETLLNLLETPGMLTQFIVFLEKKLGIYTIDTLLQSLQFVGQVAGGHLTSQKKEELNHQIFDQSAADRGTAHATASHTNTLEECMPLKQLTHPNLEVVALNKFSMGYREP